MRYLTALCEGDINRSIDNKYIARRAREAALKEVGKWLQTKCLLESGDGGKYLQPLYLSWEELDNLLQGKMPEEAK